MRLVIQFLASAILTIPIWESRSQVSSWQILGQNEIIHASSLSCSPSGGLFAGSDGDIYRSTDEGASWSTISPSIPPSNAAFVMSDSMGVLFAFHDGICRSTDNGISWEQVVSQDTLVLSMTAGPGVIFAGTSYSGILASSNHGQTWEAIPSMRVASRALLAVEAGVLFEACSDSLFGGIMRSTDVGATWEKVFSDSIGVYSVMQASSGKMFAGSSSGMIMSMDTGRTWIRMEGVCESSAVLTGILQGEGDVMFGSAIDGQVMMSWDSGVYWETIYLGDSVHFVGPVTKDSYQRLYAGTDNGIYASFDAGFFWHPVDHGFLNRSFKAFAVTPAGYIFAGTDAGIFLSTDDGSTWGGVHFPLAPPRTPSYNIRELLASRDGTVYTKCLGMGVFRSIDSGQTWTKTSLVDSEAFTIQVDTAGNVLTGGVFASYQWPVLLKSTDRGDTWDSLGTFPKWVLVYKIVVSSQNEMYAGTSWDGVFHSTDGGETWAYSGVQNNITMSLLLTPQGTILDGTQNDGLYRSTDHGAYWEKRVISAARHGVWSLLSFPDGRILAGTKLGVYESTDEGDTWRADTIGLSGASVTALIVTPSGRIIAGTQNGAYIKVGTVSAEKKPQTMPTRFKLDQNYPNPFNPSSTIRFELSHASRVSLKVYNTLGQGVATLVNGTKAAGVYTVEFDARSLASGVYFYRLEAGNFVQTRKLIVLR